MASPPRMVPNSPALLILIWALLLTLLSHPTLAGIAPLPINFTNVTRIDASRCQQYAELYSNIDVDLSPWKDGISLELMQQTIKNHGARSTGRGSERKKGFAAAFIGGKAYIVDKPALVSWVGHHVGLWAVYIRFLLHLEKLFGDQIPDCSPHPSHRTPVTAPQSPHPSHRAPVTAPQSPRPSHRTPVTAPQSPHPSHRAPVTAPQSPRPSHRAPEFVISTGDRPLLLLQEGKEHEHEPVMQFCRTELAHSVLLPNFHFYMKGYDTVRSKGYDTLLSQVKHINKDYPWDVRKPILFGRFTDYYRFLHPEDEGAIKYGVNGTELCDHGKYTKMCAVRQYFTNFTKQYYPRIDVSNRGKIPMSHHSRYKWLVHLDGQGLSSRLEQLLPLGSVIFKEESGYRGYYHHMLKPYEHYIPFWKRGPEDILEALDWAEANDKKSEEIGSNAQNFAVKYLNSEARSCYMYTLLQRYAKLLKYKPGKTPGREYMEYYETAENFLENEIHSIENGLWQKIVFE
eukprot:gene8581-34018_t